MESWVIRAKKRSTKLSQDEEVGMKCRLKRLCRFSQFCTCLARIMHNVENFCGDSGGKQPIHVANRCSTSCLAYQPWRHSHHDRRYAASVRSPRRPPQETT